MSFLRHFLNKCPTCQNGIIPGEAVVECNTCHQTYHRGEMITWITIGKMKQEPQTRPTCCANMCEAFLGKKFKKLTQLICLISMGSSRSTSNNRSAALVHNQLHNPNRNTPPGFQPAELLLNINNFDWQTGFS